MPRPRALDPDLTLLDTAGRPVAPRDWRGRPVVLIFLRWLG
jgi:peroxiredoxin